MKKYCLFFLALTLCLGLLAGTAHAVAPIPVPEAETPFMTLSGGTTAETTFGWDEQPFMYLSLSDIDTGRLISLKNIWKHGVSGTEILQTDLFYANASEADWTGLNDWFGQNGVRKTGNWILETTWGYADSRNGYCVTNMFTVTPEPFSAALFLLGGVALSTRKFFTGKRKSLVLLLALTLGLGLMAGTGYASVANPLPPYSAEETPYMTLNGNPAQKTTFGWNETPFVYLSLPSVQLGKTLNLEHIWKYGASIVDTQNFTFTGSSLTDWKGLSNWTSVRQAGAWSVTTSWGYEGSKYSTCCTDTTFTVTPEPVSLVLFGLGAGVLGLTKLRRKKR